MEVVAEFAELWANPRKIQKPQVNRKVRACWGPAVFYRVALVENLLINRSSSKPPSRARIITHNQTQRSSHSNGWWKSRNWAWKLLGLAPVQRIFVISGNQQAGGLSHAMRLLELMGSVAAAVPFLNVFETWYIERRTQCC